MAALHSQHSRPARDLPVPVRGHLDLGPEYGYIGVMKRANISYTRNHLSELIDRVREGESILILDRQQPVARLEPPGNGLEPSDARGMDLVRRGLASAPRRKPDLKGLDRLALPRPEKGGDILAALLADREEGR
jgi:antitoxin (DNA-binding transcriptional repressor) of toxin-antitoxin stability system